jgi:hypothetical protein
MELESLPSENRVMKMNFKISCLAAFLNICLISLSGCTGPEEKQIASGDQIVERGRYLVAITGCHDCHTPKVYTDKGRILDETRLLSGHPAEEGLPELDTRRVVPDDWILFNSHMTAAVGPWGVSFATNLTPDNETGIGRWTVEAFTASIRTGLHWGVGPQILPPMYWRNFSKANEQDLRAIFAYLKSVEPIKNDVPLSLTWEELTERSGAED